MNRPIPRKFINKKVNSMFCKTIKILLLIIKISRNDQQQSGDHGGIFKEKKKKERCWMDQKR